MSLLPELWYESISSSAEAVLIGLFPGEVRLTRGIGRINNAKQTRDSREQTSRCLGPLNEGQIKWVHIVRVLTMRLDATALELCNLSVRRSLINTPKG